LRQVSFLRVSAPLRESILSGSSRLGHSGLFGAAALLLVLAVMLHGAWHTWDLPWGDGASYFGRAQRVATEFRFPLFEWAPVHAGYYALFHWLLADFPPFVIYFVYRVTTLLLLGWLLLALLRRFMSPLLAWLLAVYALFLLISMGDAFTAHLFVLMPLLLACLALFLTTPYRNGIMLTCLLLAATTRTELFLPLLLLLCLVLYEDLSGTRETAVKGRRRFYYLPFVLTIVLLSVILAFRSVEREQQRSWIAFGQHYAHGYRENVPTWNADQLPGWVEITHHSFGDVSSVSAALQNNPAAFGHHFWWNIRRLPTAVTETFFPTTSWSQTQQQIVGLATLLGTLLGGRFLWQRREEWISDRSEVRIKVGLIWLATAVASFGSMLMVQPRPRHIVVLLPLVLLLLGLVVDLNLRRFNWHGRLAEVIPWLLLILLLFLPTPFKAGGERPVLSMVDQLRLFDQAQMQPYGLLTAPAFGLCAYLGSDLCQPLEIYQVPREDRPFEQILAERNIQVMVVTPWLAQNLPPNGREYVQQLKANAPTHMGWDHLDSIRQFELYARSSPYEE
jgi:hypothetical protein